MDHKELVQLNPKSFDIRAYNQDNEFRQDQGAVSYGIVNRWVEAISSVVPISQDMMTRCSGKLKQYHVLFWSVEARSFAVSTSQNKTNVLFWSAKKRLNVDPSSQNQYYVMLRSVKTRSRAVYAGGQDRFMCVSGQSMQDWMLTLPVKIISSAVPAWQGQIKWEHDQ